MFRLNLSKIFKALKSKYEAFFKFWDTVPPSLFYKKAFTYISIFTLLTSISVYYPETHKYDVFVERSEFNKIEVATKEEIKFPVHTLQPYPNKKEGLKLFRKPTEDFYTLGEIYPEVFDERENLEKGVVKNPFDLSYDEEIIIDSGVILLNPQKEKELKQLARTNLICGHIKTKYQADNEISWIEDYLDAYPLLDGTEGNYHLRFGPYLNEDLALKDYLDMRVNGLRQQCKVVVS